jgi:hypothetical protein
MHDLGSVNFSPLSEEGSEIRSRGPYRQRDGRRQNVGVHCFPAWGQYASGHPFRSGSGSELTPPPISEKGSVEAIRVSASSLAKNRAQYDSQD